MILRFISPLISLYGISQQTFVLMKTSSRRLQDVFRLRLQKTSWRRLQDVLVKTNIFVLAICLQDVFKTSSRPLQGVFKTYSRRFEDVLKMSLRHLRDILQRYLQDVFKAFHQVNLFYLARPREVLKTFLSTEEFA